MCRPNTFLQKNFTLGDVLVCKEGGCIYLGGFSSSKEVHIVPIKRQTIKVMEDRSST